MVQEIEFKRARTPDNKTQFIWDGITITIDACSNYNGKHAIATPHTATACYACAGKKYTVTNLQAILTVEDWYVEELLPKFQMLRLLLEDIDL